MNMRSDTEVNLARDSGLPTRWKTISLLCGALFSPLAVFSACAWLAYVVPHGLAPVAASAALAASVVAGLPFVLALPVSRRARAVLTVMYLPVSAGVVFLYSLYFVCAVFGDCV
jgi:hypothetical protein